MKRIMVVGASGVLGKFICHEVLRLFNLEIQLIITDYDKERGKRLADGFDRQVQFCHFFLGDNERLNQVLADVDGVVIALKQEKPLIQKACIEQGVLCVDVTPFYEFVDKVSNLNEEAEEAGSGSVVMTGFFPGLSALMVKKAIEPFSKVTEIHIGLLQNVNANVGTSGIKDMLKIISEPVMMERTRMRGFQMKRKMEFQSLKNATEVRLIEHSEKKIIVQKLGLDADSVHYWTSWNKRRFNLFITLLIKSKLISYIPMIDGKVLSKVVKHNPKKTERAYLTVEVKGIVSGTEQVQSVRLSTESDYRTTAMVAAALLKIALQKGVVGVVCPFEMASLDEVLKEINSKDIVIEEQPTIS
ncbi:saccharopine dehydrogenase NADP-binding domain-containing protein [Shouchella patagoniensis]|uniref:saccharopine dehydrogenase NADP-binding domain-containing protein n=1 Tax=Shouchella patagoniensis TaxID=228576 RepID=UPI000994AA74|nr:saccharopine dehydrogenase NADP-binding domain-containing protein [Shouchella patagoniensis]